MSVYLEVDDLDRAWNRILEKRTQRLNARKPFTRENGVREFHIEIPKTKTLLFVGQRQDAN